MIQMIHDRSPLYNHKKESYQMKDWRWLETRLKEVHVPFFGLVFSASTIRPKTGGAQFNKQTLK